ELYDSIKITRAKHIEQVTKITAENVTLKTSVSKAKVQPPVLTRTKHAVDVKPIVPCLRNNRDAHLDYLRHLKERVTSYPKASGSQPKSNPKTNRISPAKGANKLPVEDLPRMNKSHLRTTNRVDSSSLIKRTVINSNSDSICQTCNKCLTSFDHDMKGYRIYNKRTRRIMETIHIQFDELTEPMAPVHLSTRPAPNFLMPGQISSGLVPNLAERPGSSAQAVQAPVTSAGVVAEPHFIEDHNIAPVDNNPFINVLTLQ
nr:integrase, catalytic region, zinc finger, CCHC-type, peptidase aspartic, catalytic [Tanacetum cinerariifolium]